MVELKKLLLSAAIFVVMAGSAAAHTAFLKPSEFYATGDRVMVQSAFTTQFFTAGVGFYAPQFHVIAPNGQSEQFTGMNVTAQDAHLEAGVIARGTYRITSGEWLDAVTPMVADGTGGWRPLAAGEAPAEGTPTTTVQRVTLSETYVTRGAPTRTAVDTNVGFLAIHPITHPNQVLAGSGFELELLKGGTPFPGVSFVLYDSGDPDSKTDRYFTTDAQGRATLTFDHPGTYVAAIRYLGAAPADAGVAMRSYTTTLTFEVLSELPPPPPPEPVQRPTRRRSHDRLF